VRLSVRLFSCALLFMSVMALGLSACDDDEGGGGLRLTQSGLLVTSPEQVIFPVLVEGQRETRSLSVSNRGSAEVIISALAVSPASELFSVTRLEGEALSFPLTIAAEETLELVVTYEAGAEQPSGDEAVLIRTNISTQLEVSVPIVTSNASPEIIASRPEVSFEAVDAGERAEERLTLTNVGEAPLLISELRLSNPEFSASFIDQSGEVVQVEDALEPTLSIASGEGVEVTIAYAPAQAGADLDELRVVSNDPTTPNLTIPIRANGAAPCLQLTPSSLDFGAGLLVPSRDEPTPNTRPVVVESCGGTNLKISRVEFEGEAFGFQPAPEPASEELLIELPAASSDAPFPSTTLNVAFWPTQEMNYGGRMKLFTNTSAEPVEVDLFGRGVENACPIPDVAEARFDVAPLDIITLDGSPSVDPGGEVKRWVWTVVERPSGSVSQVFERLTDPLSDPAGGGDPDDELTPTGVFFVDLAGRYTFELQVYDNLDQASCEPNAVARVEVEAVPEKDLHIQLVWSTPEDPDEADDKGTDVDLHFKHELAGEAWGGSANGYDCFFQNKSPDWGAMQDFTDNPSLDIDDINGAGPENVNLNNPEVGVSYDIGALYFRAESTFGEAGRDPRVEHLTYATLRLFARGELIAEFVDRELSSVSQLWHVASVNWCEDELRCPEVTPIDRLYQEGEYTD
jgi:hypothetical protein